MYITNKIFQNNAIVCSCRREVPNADWRQDQWTNPVSNL